MRLIEKNCEGNLQKCAASFKTSNLFKLRWKQIKEKQQIQSNYENHLSDMGVLGNAHLG